ncbi:uncharacterized protein [Amphiura filiformis]|uniref:uncharacterized protein n=1 Tax=Amphiura filiformis TaxID=82378 RepID=UPI003B20ECC6
MSQIGKVQDPFEVEAFPVPLLTLFSEHFTMCRVQEAFKSAGLFPLKPEQVQLPKEEPVRKSKSKKKAKGTKTNAKESEKVANVSNQKTKSNGLESLVVQSSNSGESILLKVCSEVVLNSDGASTSNGDGGTPAVSLLESMQKSLSANKEPNLDMKASSSNNTVPIITPVKNPTAIDVSTSSSTSSQPATSTSKSDPVTFTLHSQDASTPEPKQDSHFNTEVLNSIVVVKKQNEDRRSYVMLKKMTSTLPKTTGIPTASTQPKMTDMPTSSTAAGSAVTAAVPTTPSSSVQQTTAIPMLSPPSNNPPQPSATQPIPVKITKADEDATSFPSCDVLLGVTSSTPVSSNSAPGSTGNTSTSSTPVSSNSGPGSTGNTSLTTDVTTVTATSASSSTDAVESDSDDNDSDLDISEVDVEPSNTASILKQPKPVLTTPSTSILDHIQSVIAKNTDILSSSDIKKSKTSRKANKAASKSAVSTIKPSVSEPRKAPSQTTVPTTAARTSSVPIVTINKPSGLEPQMAPSQTTVPTVPISVIAAKLQQHVLSQRRKPNPSVRVVQSYQSATSATISAPFKQQSTITAGCRNTVPSQGSAITSSALVPSTSGGVAVAVTPISSQQQPQVSKSQAHLTKSEAATLSKIAKAFNADVADIILAVKNQQKTLATQRRPPEKTSGAQPSSNQPHAQARIAQAPATPVVPLVAPVVTVYNPLQQAQGAPILVSGGTLFPIVQQQPLIFPLPQATMGMIPVTGVPTVAPAVTNARNTPSATATTSASATASAATKNSDSSTMGVTPVTVVTNVAHAVTKTKLTPFVTSTTSASATVNEAVTSTNKDSSTMSVTPVTVVTNVATAVTNTKLTPTVIATTSAPTISVRASATVVPSVKSGSSSFSVKPKVTSDKVMIVTEPHTETTAGVRMEHEESSSKVDSQNPSLRISPQAQDVTVVYAKTSGNSAETSRQDKIDSQNTSVKKLTQKQVITDESDVQTSGSSSRTSSGYTVVTVRKSSQKQVLVTSVEPSTNGTPKADTQSHNPTEEAVTEQLSTITSENSDKSDNGSAVATVRKSPRKQVMVTREEPGEPSTSNPSKTECESPVVTGSRKRKASLISSTKMEKRKEDSDKGVKMLGVETVAEGRKTRAQVREESLPSRRTRSMKR